MIVERLKFKYLGECEYFSCLLKGFKGKCSENEPCREVQGVPRSVQPHKELSCYNHSRFYGIDQPKVVQEDELWISFFFSFFLSENVQKIY